ncbi:MAG: helix-turn-helix domain-containing protein [Acidimicrobiia bacterium]
MATDELERNLGAGVRALRIGARLTQVELADRANVSVGALKHLESGAGATITTLVKVLRALDADDWLGTLSPPATFDPMALLEQRRKEVRAAKAPTRVRHKRDADLGAVVTPTRSGTP